MVRCVVVVLIAMSKAFKLINMCVDKQVEWWLRMSGVGERKTIVHSSIPSFIYRCNGEHWFLLALEKNESVPYLSLFLPPFLISSPERGRKWGERDDIVVCFWMFFFLSYLMMMKKKRREKKNMFTTVDLIIY